MSATTGERRKGRSRSTPPFPADLHRRGVADAHCHCSSTVPEFFLSVYITRRLTEMDDIEASVGSWRFAFALSRYVTAGIRIRWLNWTVALWIIGAGCSEFWPLVHGIRRPSCGHKRCSRNKDQEHKEDGLGPRKERSLAHITAHHDTDISIQVQ